MESAQVSLKEREALVTTDGRITAGAIIASLAELGVSGTLVPAASRHRQRSAPEMRASSPRIITASYPVVGMTCASCAVSVESMLKAEPGVTDAAVNYVNQSVRVSFDQHSITPLEMREVVKSIGYDLLIDVREDSDELERAHAKRIQTLTIRTIGSAVLAIPSVVIAMLLMDFVPGARWVMMALTAPVMLWAGRDFFTTAWNQAKRGTSTMDTLVALSTGTAFLYSSCATIAPEFFARHGLHPHVYYEAAAGKWVTEALERTPLKEAALNHEVALRSREVSLPHQDPADRFLVATALTYVLTLVTADDTLIEAKACPVLAN